jgi:hypothetical protein
MTNLEPAPAQATIRTMIVCIPDGVTPQMLTTAHPAHPAFDDTTTFSTRFWATPKLRLWHRRQLINVRRGRKGTPTGCAGGRLSHLNLTLMRNTAGFHAGMRWQQWHQAVTGTRPARPWHEFAAEHRANPAKVRLDEARTRFFAQSRINAMRAYTAANPAAVPLDPYEVEMYQAGQQAYQHYHAMYVICADAIMPLSGDRIQPASDSLADRLTYLHQVTRLLHNLAATQRIAAISL